MSRQDVQKEGIFSDLIEDHSYHAHSKSSVLHKTSHGLIETVKAKLTAFYLFLKQRPKLVISMISIVFLSIIGIIIMIIYGVDVFIFPAKAEITVINETTGNPVQNATILIEDRFFVRSRGNQFITDDNGTVKMGNLRIGLISMTVNAPGFESFQNQVPVNRGENHITIQLKQVDYSSLRLQLNTSNKYSFSTAILTINGIEYEMDPSGLIVSDNLNIGPVEVFFSSPEYKDFTKSFTLSPGENDKGEINLEESGDLIITITDWLTSTPLINENITINQKEYQTNQNGRIQIRDLNISDEVRTEVRINSYLSTDVSTLIIQGLNKVPLELVPQGKVTYHKAKSSVTGLYVSNLDGSEEELISQEGISLSEESNVIYSNDGSRIFFYSTKDSLKNDTAAVIPLPYFYSIPTGESQKLFLSGNIDGDPYFFPKTGQMIAVSDGVYIGEISGENLHKIYSVNDSELLTDFKLSESGEYIAYSRTVENDPSLSGLYRMKRDGSEQQLLIQGEVDILDISVDGNLILFSHINNHTLLEFNISESKIITIFETGDPLEHAHFSPQSGLISFIQKQNNASHLYITSANGGSPKEIISNGNLTSYHWTFVDDYMMYVVGNAAFVIDTRTIQDGKKITEDVLY